MHDGAFAFRFHVQPSLRIPALILTTASVPCVQHVQRETQKHNACHNSVSAASFKNHKHTLKHGSQKLLRPRHTRSSSSKMTSFAATERCFLSPSNQLIATLTVLSIHQCCTRGGIHLWIALKFNMIWPCVMVELSRF